MALAKWIATSGDEKVLEMDFSFASIVAEITSDTSFTYSISHRLLLKANSENLD